MRISTIESVDNIKFFAIYANKLFWIDYSEEPLLCLPKQRSVFPKQGKIMLYPFTFFIYIKI